MEIVVKQVYLNQVWASPSSPVLVSESTPGSSISAVYIACRR